MVELCELQMMPEDDNWPEDIDTRVANLDFGGDSVLFESFDPSVSTDSLDSEQLREQCRPRRDDYQMAFADSGHWQSQTATAGLTTWGRIHSTEPLDEKVVSAPDMTTRGMTAFSANATQPRTSSLLANFVDSRRSEGLRFVDVNDNEIAAEPEDRWRRISTAPAKPKRTFADLQRNMAPELQFLALPHKMPSLCESSSLSLSDVMLKVQREGLPGLTSERDLNNLPVLLAEDSPDSGLGCSGPSHIEDWASLSVLLPRHVADACSFFKNNSQLLCGPADQQSTSNCIDGSTKRSLPCRTCFRVRRRLHPPSWAHSTTSRHVLCDCSDSYEGLMPRTPRTPVKPALRARELSVVGLPIYAAKRLLVENVVEGVAAVARGDGGAELIAALVTLISDGLKGEMTPWKMICIVTAPGPATKDVHSIVKKLDSSEKSPNSRVEIFFEELLSEHSLDCWLCYVVLKENILAKLYDDAAFLLRAPSAYRSLLWRLIDSLALLPVLETRESIQSQYQTRSMYAGPSRLPSDSRVPKSSSVPARLSTAPAVRPSRIPLPVNGRSMSRASSISNYQSPIASVMQDSDRPGQLTVSRGERVRVLTRRGEVAHVSRLRPQYDKLRTGVVPVAILDFQ